MPDFSAVLIIILLAPARMTDQIAGFEIARLMACDTWLVLPASLSVLAICMLDFHLRAKPGNCACQDCATVKRGAGTCPVRRFSFDRVLLQGRTALALPLPPCRSLQACGVRLRYLERRCQERLHVSADHADVLYV